MTPSPQYHIKNLAIAASAGAGKTFQLVHRFIGLLALGVEPDRIIALTFSRKAAGEMFDRVIEALADAAADDEKARGLNRQLHTCEAVPKKLQLDKAEACRLLRRLLDTAHRSRIGTLDSFLVSIVQAFPFEFGLGGEFSILEGYPASAAKQETLRQVLLLQGGADSNAGRGFLESFKQAAYGQELKSFSDTIQRFIDDYHALLLEARAPELWGNPEKIWAASGCSWINAREYPEKEAKVFRKYLESFGLTDQQQAKCDQFFEALPGFHPVADWENIKYMFEKLRDIHADLLEGGAELSLYRKKIELSEAACAQATRILEYIIAQVITAHLERTRGLYHVLDTYENSYRGHIRQTGRLTFTDVTFLLNSHRLSEAAPGNLSPPPLTANAAEPDRLYVDYRLDSHFDHWLLDEFQDTSTFQWHAIENLIDEIVQDRSGQRSFFYVGDVKQAIYGWRGGDPKLFEWVRHKYGADEQGDIIERRPLAQSWRSSQPVIDTVNHVFDDLRGHELDIPPALFARWDESWNTHRTARREEPGFAVLYSLPREKGQKQEDLELARFAATLQVLREVKPIEKGHTVGALVRTNDQGRKLADYLRNAGIPVLYSGTFNILDTPLTAAFVSLIKLAEHPGDSYAWQHLRMTPLREVIPDTPTPPDAFIMELLHKIGGHGFEAFVKLWFSRLHSEITAFENKRFRDLLTAAREFDATGNRNTGDFLEYLEAYEVEDGGNPHAVQVMTVHKAKGLQFDMVLLPALDRGSGINSVRSGGLHIEKTDTADRTPCWVLDMPRKDIALADPVLSDTLESLKVDAAYEEMCNLYVAMTRAKYALYMFRTEAGRSSHAVYPSTVAAAGLAREVPEQITLGEQLAELLYKCGDPSWHEKLAPPEPQPPRELPRLKKRDNSRNRRRYQRETPSGDEETETRAGWLFSPENDEFAAFGRALHAFASQIEWYREDLDLDKVYTETMKDLDTEPYIARDAFAQLQTAFQAPAIREALSKPQNPAEVWLEKSFEMVLDQTWISGIFDRVVIEYNDAGQPVKATIIDYKTSVITGPDSLAANRRKYTPQLRTYRKALARMTGLAEKDIIARLIFTKTADIINLD